MLRRFAIRAKVKGEERWYTDDGQGGDEACDFTDWDARELVTYVTREEAQSQADWMREYASKRGLRLRVVAVKETSAGFER